MKEIAIIIPYFGKLPEWIQLFINSCALSKEKIDFFIFTDDPVSSKLICPENVFIKNVPFKWLQYRIKIKGLGRLDFAYKLCDYKPIYGYIFEDYIEEYLYWGYCDVDTILGDVVKFLEQYNYKEYDRIGSFGHFTLYKNNEFCKQLFRKNNKKYPRTFCYQFVIKTAYPCHFDESGMNVICKDVGLKFLDVNLALQTTIVHEFHLHTNNCKEPELFVYEKGRLIRFIRHESNVEEKEYMYIHFQDRKVMPVENECEDSFLITHLGFKPFERKNLDSYFEEYGRYDTPAERLKYLQETTGRLKKAKKERMLREFQFYGFRAFYNIFMRYKGILYLKRNGLF